MPRASYTQWEFLLARHLGKTMVICCPRPGREPLPDKRDDELTAPDDTALQAAFVQNLVASGAPRIEFSDTHELCRVVMRQPWVQATPGAAEHKPIILPYPSLGTLFKGRDAFMQRLRASLARDGGGTAAVVHSAVHGLGGVGKTRAAVEYGHRYAHEYTAVALLEAETPDKLRSSLAQLIGPLRLTGAPPEEDGRVEAAIQWLNDNPGWFLILDNIDTGAALQAAHALLGRLRRVARSLVGEAAREAQAPLSSTAVATTMCVLVDGAAEHLERVEVVEAVVVAVAEPVEQHVKPVEFQHSQHRLDPEHSLDPHAAKLTKRQNAG
jgi:hypothetical protein